jgi:Protein phosphatase 2C
MYLNTNDTPFLKLLFRIYSHIRAIFSRMGQTLSEPVTDKESACCQNEYMKVGSSSMQGWRINMEDSHCHILSLPDDPGTVFLAVYDGHGGKI